MNSQQGGAIGVRQRSYDSWTIRPIQNLNSESEPVTGLRRRSVIGGVGGGED